MAWPELQFYLVIACVLILVLLYVNSIEQVIKEEKIKTPRYFMVNIRRAEGYEVKPEAEIIDGEVFLFKYGWTQDENERYSGERVWIPADVNYPVSAPSWIAEGDLLELP